MPGASILAASTPAEAPLSNGRPAAAVSMTSAAMPPGRSRRSVPASTFTMVDSSTTWVGPPSTMSGILLPRSASTASAVVEVIRPDELALGAASGRPKLR